MYWSDVLTLNLKMITLLVPFHFTICIFHSNYSTVIINLFLHQVHNDVNSRSEWIMTIIDDCWGSRMILLTYLNYSTTLQYSYYTSIKRILPAEDEERCGSSQFKIVTWGTCSYSTYWAFLLNFIISSTSCINYRLYTYLLLKVEINSWPTTTWYSITVATLAVWCKYSKYLKIIQLQNLLTVSIMNKFQQIQQK